MVVHSIITHLKNIQENVHTIKAHINKCPEIEADQISVESSEFNGWHTMYLPPGSKNVPHWYLLLHRLMVLTQVGPRLHPLPPPNHHSHSSYNHSMSFYGVPHDSFYLLQTLEPWFCSLHFQLPGRERASSCSIKISTMSFKVNACTLTNAVLYECTWNTRLVSDWCDDKVNMWQEKVLLAIAVISTGWTTLWN